MPPSKWRIQYTNPDGLTATPLQRLPKKWGKPERQGKKTTAGVWAREGSGWQDDNRVNAEGKSAARNVLLAVANSTTDRIYDGGEGKRQAKKTPKFLV